MTTETDTAADMITLVPMTRSMHDPEHAKAEPPPAHASLVCRLTDVLEAIWVDESSIRGWSQQAGDCVVLLAGDPVCYPQGLDVAAVLPELRKCAIRSFKVAVVARDREDAVAKRYGVNHWPTLLFLRDSQYVTAIGGMHDWSAYMNAVNAALQMPVSRTRAIGIPIVSANRRDGSCN